MSEEGWFQSRPLLNFAYAGKIQTIASICMIGLIFGFETILVKYKCEVGISSNLGLIAVRPRPDPLCHTRNSLKLKTSDIYTKNQLKLVMKTVTVRDKLHDKKK